MKKLVRDKKIIIYEVINVAPPAGMPKPGLFPIHPGTVWAYYRQTSGSEYFLARAQAFEETVLFTVSYNAKIEPGVIVKYKGKLYDITRVDAFEGYKTDVTLYGTTRKEAGREVFYEYGDPRP